MCFTKGRLPAGLQSPDACLWLGDAEALEQLWVLQGQLDDLHRQAVGRGTAVRACGMQSI